MFYFRLWRIHNQELSQPIEMVYHKLDKLDYVTEFNDTTSKWDVLYWFVGYSTCKTKLQKHIIEEWIETTNCEKKELRI